MHYQDQPTYQRLAGDASVAQALGRAFLLGSALMAVALFLTPGYYLALLMVATGFAAVYYYRKAAYIRMMEKTFERGWQLIAGYLGVSNNEGPPKKELRDRVLVATLEASKEYNDLEIFSPHHYSAVYPWGARKDEMWEALKPIRKLPVFLAVDEARKAYLFYEEPRRGGIEIRI